MKLSSNSKVRTKPLKIGFVLDDGLDKPDGVQQYILALGDWLRSQGHNVIYLVGQTSRSDIEGVVSLSRNLRVNGNGNSMSIPLLANRFKIKRLLAREQFDILHVQVPYSPLMGGQLIKLAGPKTAVVGTFHILPNSRVISLATRLLGIWSHRTLRRFDYMISVSSAAASFAKQSFKVSSSVLPNVINYEKFHGAKPLNEYVTDDTLTILFLGRLVPRKGSEQLIQAVALLVNLQNIPKFRVVICGRGPLRSSLEQLIKKHMLEEFVTLVGFVSEIDKPRYFASADIAVFPSRGGESFGIVLLEAMASGQAAVLAGDNPGYRSVLAPRPSLLFDPLDPQALANKLAEYLTNHALRKEAAAWGADYTRKFDVAVVGQQLLKIYLETLHKRQNT